MVVFCGLPQQGSQAASSSSTKAIKIFLGKGNQHNQCTRRLAMNSRASPPRLSSEIGDTTSTHGYVTILRHSKVQMRMIRSPVTTSVPALHRNRPARSSLHPCQHDLHNIKHTPHKTTSCLLLFVLFMMGAALPRRHAGTAPSISKQIHPLSVRESTTATRLIFTCRLADLPTWPCAVRCALCAVRRVRTKLVWCQSAECRRRSRTSVCHTRRVM